MDTEKKPLYDQLSVLAETYSLALEPPGDRFDQAAFDAFAESVYKTLSSPEVMYTSLAILRSDDPDGVSEIACATDALAYWIASMKAVAENHLRLMKKSRLMMKTKLWTDMDRNVQLEAECNHAITLCNLLENQYKHLCMRITLCENTLNNTEDEKRRSRSNRT